MLLFTNVQVTFCASATLKVQLVGTPFPSTATALPAVHAKSVSVHPAGGVFSLTVYVPALMFRAPVVAVPGSPVGVRLGVRLVGPVTVKLKVVPDVPWVFFTIVSVGEMSSLVI